MSKTKNLFTALVAGGLLAAGIAAAPAFAQTASSGTTTSSTTAKKVTHAPAKAKAKVVHERRKVERRRTERRSTRKVDPLLGTAASTIPAGALLWSCGDGNSIYVAGDMKRDQILTISWKGRDYKLPRETTTTGADRFYDPASGMDLVVIPTKAMLFMDKGDQTRLADDCMTAEMRQHGTPAPTQSNELIRIRN